MPRPKKKTPLSEPILATEKNNSQPPKALDPPLIPNSPKTESLEVKTKKPLLPRSPFLSVAEKRKWLASILRDVSGQHQGYELGLGDKFKALIEDNKLAGHPESELSADKDKPEKEKGQNLQEFLQSLLATIRPPHIERFKDKP